MPARTPRSLSKFNRTGLPAMLDAVRGGDMLRTVAEIVETDKWNSFDRFHETTETMVRHFENGGAETEVYPIQTGGRIGSGRWIIQEAADVHSATVDVVRPVRQRLLDYAENPWHVIQWGTGTPKEGLRCRLAILDSSEEIDRMGRDGLAGRVVLTRLSPRGMLKKLADKGAVGVITDSPVPNNPDGLAWTKFGWGAIPMQTATARLVGFVLSANQGKKLRKLAARHGELTLHLKADIRKYVGTHDVVSGIIRGAEDPQDEVWAIAHSAEPGAIDNASGVTLTLEIARVLEGLIAAGKLPRPKRTIRLLCGYECYGFFAYLERVRRLQTVLAGVCIDSVGACLEVCGGRVEWHSTIPMSAGFVDRVGESILRSAVRRHRSGYRVYPESFVSTSDTQIGDPGYGFPCPWITTHHQGPGRGFDAYHSSADTVKLLSGKGMEICAASMAGYLYFLADMGSREVAEIGAWETQRTLGQLEGARLSPAEGRFVETGHRKTMGQLQRWLWGGDRGEILGRFEENGRQVEQACQRAVRKTKKKARVPAGARLVPQRTGILAPTMENVPDAIARRINSAGLKPWTLFWADGKRSIAEIAEMAACETTGRVGQKGDGKKQEIDLERYIEYFEGHAELGYVKLIDPKEMVSRARLVADLKRLGVEPGMDLMVHSSLSSLGYVEGGADAVVDALLAAIGKQGTLVMPSFNHKGAQVYNPMTTPTTNGAIADAMWRRREAVRSNHPTHAVAAIGPKAEEICRDHLEVGIWAQDSPIGRLIHGGGYILALGISHSSSTAYHVAELSMPCSCIDMFGNIDEVVFPDGSVRKVEGLAFRSGECPVPTSKLDETLNRRKLQRVGKVGSGDCGLVKGIDLWKVRREHLRRACPTCEIEPGVRRG